MHLDYSLVVTVLSLVGNGFFDGELFGRKGRSSGGGTTLFWPQPCVESGNLLQNKALGVMRLVEGFFAESGLPVGETLPFQEMPDFDSGKGELRIVCRQTCV